MFFTFAVTVNRTAQIVFELEKTPKNFSSVLEICTRSARAATSFSRSIRVPVTRRTLKVLSLKKLIFLPVENLKTTIQICFRIDVKYLNSKRHNRACLFRYRNVEDELFSHALVRRSNRPLSFFPCLQLAERFYRTVYHTNVERLLYRDHRVSGRTYIWRYRIKSRINIFNSTDYVRQNFVTTQLFVIDIIIGYS